MGLQIVLGEGGPRGCPGWIVAGGDVLHMGKHVGYGSSLLAG